MLAKSIKIELIEKIGTESGCPICSIILDYEFHLLSKLQYEISNDEQIRKEIAIQGGFCDFHFRQFKKLANGKTNIIFLKSIIEEGAFKKENFKVKCSICKKVDNYQTAVVKSFVDLLPEKENAEKFDQSNGICFEHLELVCDFIDDEKIKNWLRKIHVVQIERLQKDFDYMNNANSFYEIERAKRGLINALIQKLTGRKSGGL